MEKKTNTLKRNQRGERRGAHGEEKLSCLTDIAPEEKNNTTGEEKRKRGGSLSYRTSSGEKNRIKGGKKEWEKPSKGATSAIAL